MANECPFERMQQQAYEQRLHLNRKLMWSEPNKRQEFAAQPEEPEQNNARHPLQENDWAALKGNVWTLSAEEKGCRLIQQALEEAPNDEVRMSLVEELRPHVWDAMRCPNANYVIQKCIGSMGPAKLQFIIDEIRGKVSQVARHKYSCRTLQRLMEHCPPEQLHELVQELLTEAVDLCTHMFGSYVLKHLLEHGAPAQVAALKSIMAANVSTISEHSYGSAVLCAALEQSSQQSTIVLVDAFLQDPALLGRIAHSRHGQLSVKLALQVAATSLPAQRQAALSALKGAKRMLSASRYGRALNKHVEQLR